jgi:inorganic phosphate transporter, PiT family
MSFSFELIMVIVLALAFDFVNGFHDAANAIATCVSTRALSPRNAIIMARSLNFVGALVHTAVATTIGKGLIDLAGHSNAMSIVLVALIGAIGWDLITWYFGLPSSSTHALVGGMVGAGIAALGFKCLVWSGLRKILLAMVLSPILGVIAGLITVSILYWIFRRSHPGTANRHFRWAQIGSAAWMSFSHGMNDAQTSMGIITLALMTAGFIQATGKDAFPVPIYVKVASAIMMGVGTSAGGWRIIKTMGQRLVDLKPIDGFAAEFSSGAVIFASAWMGAPVSTTHVISCAIMGTGAAKSITSVRWNVVRRIIMAWILTIPGAGLIAIVSWWIRTLIFG